MFVFNMIILYSITVNKWRMNVRMEKFRFSFVHHASCSQPLPHSPGISFSRHEHFELRGLPTFRQIAARPTKCLEKLKRAWVRRYQSKVNGNEAPAASIMIIDVEQDALPSQIITDSVWYSPQGL